MELDASKTAIIALHWINDIVSDSGAFGGVFAGEVRRTGSTEAAQRVLEGARGAGTPIFYTRVVYPPDHADIVVNGPLYQMIVDTGAFKDGSAGVQIIPELEPADADEVLDGRRVGAFTETDLHDRLQKRGIDTVVLTGVSTHLTVQATALAASDLGYRVVIVSDACSADSAETHDNALKALSLLCEINSADDVLRAFQLR